MIDKESTIFTAIATAVRTSYPSAYIIGETISTAPPSFPAISVIMNGNEINTKYSTFGSLENVARESYKIEIYSNLVTGGKAQCKTIAGVIDGVMNGQGYIRSFNESIDNIDPSIKRRVVRYKKSNVI